MIHNPALHAFYVSGAWQHKRAEILAHDHYECQSCKARGYYTPATHVHHVMHYDKHPEMGLSDYYTDRQGKQQRNLISLCFKCHADIHKYGIKPRKPPITTEKW